MPIISGMVRPVELKRDGDCLTVLRCDECVAEYLVNPSDYAWMFERDVIVCEGCGSELVPLEDSRDEPQGPQSASVARA